ncbi:hypothetical protein Thiowin_00489 [Thiorhodovibrio winogradskyi]|uniref:Uncharacterized protein n=1 Tax=Thiorhodovibrio winogradskyi TaxID=77007 RepID=A0ABZ0S340_9GAMM
MPQQQQDNMGAGGTCICPKCDYLSLPFGWRARRPVLSRLEPASMAFLNSET